MGVERGGFANMDRVYAMGSCRGNTLESKKYTAIHKDQVLANSW